MRQTTDHPAKPSTPRPGGEGDRQNDDREAVATGDDDLTDDEFDELDDEEDIEDEGDDEFDELDDEEDIREDEGDDEEEL